MNVIDNPRPLEPVEDAAVHTLAEHYYECGFGPNRSLAMARRVAEAPADDGGDW